MPTPGCCGTTVTIPDCVASQLFLTFTCPFVLTRVNYSFFSCILIRGLRWVDKGDEGNVARRIVAESLASKKVPTEAIFVLADVWVGVSIQLIIMECSDREGGSRREVE